MCVVGGGGGGDLGRLKIRATRLGGGGGANTYCRG